MGGCARGNGDRGSQAALRSSGSEKSQAAHSPENGLHPIQAQTQTHAQKEGNMKWSRKVLIALAALSSGMLFYKTLEIFIRL